MEELAIKTFKEVHEELEQEAMFISKKHDITGFSKKADFLLGCGFKNSIATKMYKSIVQSQYLIKDYGLRYSQKFILEAQLERVCEKYDLYVRGVDMFLADIPEWNIKEMMDFRLEVKDLIIYNSLSEIPRAIMAIVENNYKETTLKEYDNVAKAIYLGGNVDDMYRNGYERQVERALRGVISLGELSKLAPGSIEIAAVKNMFSEKAFEKSSQRIINNAELSPKAKVNIDPIVTVKVYGGRLIVTAWGDESNDELVSNKQLLN